MNDGYSKKYIIVKNAFIQGANAESSYMTNGISMASFIGFLDAFKYKMNNKYDIQNDDDDIYSNNLPPVDILTRDGVFIILKKYQPILGNKRIPNTLITDQKADLNPAYFQMKETFYDCQLTFAMEITTSLDDTNELRNCFINHLMNSKIAGGKIVNLNTIENNIYVQDNLEEANLILERERGWFIANKNEDFKKKIKDYNNSPQEAIKHYLFSIKNENYDKNNNEKKYYKNEKGWFFLSLRGYKLLEETVYKENARKGLKHAYAEPILGLFELKFFRNLENNMFFKWKKENNQFLITNQ